MQMHFEVQGVVVPLLTPFVDGGECLDEAALQSNIEWLIGKGVNGFMPCGTTGEAALLTTTERKRIVEITVETANHRVPVLAHVGAATTARTIALARHAVEVGAEAISVVTPWYYLLSDDALLAHYCAVAQAVPSTPLYLYNIPQNANNTITRALAERIVAACPNVVGIKDSAGKLDGLQSFVGLRGGSFQVVCGSDSLQLAALQAGAVAGVSGNANVVPELVLALYDAWYANDLARASEKQELLTQSAQAMGNGSSLALFKAIATWRGLRTGSVRSPLPHVDAARVEAAAQQLKALGVVND